MTVDERLALIRVKVKRAKKHIGDLEREIRAFLDSNPYEIGTKPDQQAAEAIKYYIVSLRETPDPILLNVGDVLSNLRAALDHLAYQLAWLNGTRDERTLKATYFPIFDSAAKYKAEALGKVKGMSKTAQKLIAKTEPYQGGNDTLWRLHRLNNIDKHRFLITAGFNVAAFIPQPLFRVGILKALAAQEGIPVTASDAQLKTIRISFPISDPSFPLKEGDELTLPFDRIPDIPELKKDIKFTFDIAFNEPKIIEREPLLPTLVGMADRVDDLIVSFRPLLA